MRTHCVKHTFLRNSTTYYIDFKTVKTHVFSNCFGNEIKKKYFFFRRVSRIYKTGEAKKRFATQYVTCHDKCG